MRHGRREKQREATRQEWMVGSSGKAVCGGRSGSGGGGDGDGECCRASSELKRVRLAWHNATRNANKNRHGRWVAKQANENDQRTHELQRARPVFQPHQRQRKKRNIATHTRPPQSMEQHQTLERRPPARPPARKKTPKSTVGRPSACRLGAPHGGGVAVVVGAEIRRLPDELEDHRHRGDRVGHVRLPPLPAPPRPRS